MKIWVRLSGLLILVTTKLILFARPGVNCAVRIS